MDNTFLSRLGKVLKTGKSASCQRAIERLLTTVQKRYENGDFDSAAEAEAALRDLVNTELICNE